MVLVIQSLFGFLWVPFYGGGGGRGKKWKGRGGRRILFIVPSLPILYSFCIVNPTCHLLKADYKQSLSFGKVCYPEKKILLVVHLKYTVKT